MIVVITGVRRTYKAFLLDGNISCVSKMPSIHIIGRMLLIHGDYSPLMFLSKIKLLIKQIW